MSHGKVVVITGAAGALGQALTTHFAAAGASAVIAADRDTSALASLATSISTDTQIDTIETDVTDRRSVEELAAKAVDRHQRIDVLINNAGILGESGRIHHQSDEAWRQAFDVNLMGVVHGMSAAIPVMRAAGSGSIINTASIAGTTAWTHTGPYGASKAAVIHLSRIAALEYAPDGIRVNCVCPGQFTSEMLQDIPADALASTIGRHPLGQGRPEDLIGAFAYLAGDDSPWTTGTVLVVDGGYSLP
jgi:NAD(P)-dependent dehydrogenase (short-subunit alcohol dehydrogenase family)